MSCRCDVCCSPFKTRILPSFDASKVVVSGDGVRPRGVLASLPTSFVIDTREAGLADLDVVIQVFSFLPLLMASWQGR